MLVIGVDCSPAGGGRTRRAIEAVLAPLSAVETRVLDGRGDPGAVADGLAGADAYVFGSPIYRASYAAPFKAVLDAVPRGMWGETEAPLTARPVAIVATGASAHHFLGTADMRNVLAGFFAAHVLSPGLYVPADGFGPEGELQPPYAELAAVQGRALGALAGAVERHPELAAIRPQA